MFFQSGQELLAHIGCLFVSLGNISINPVPGYHSRANSEHHAITMHFFWAYNNSILLKGLFVQYSSVSDIITMHIHMLYSIYAFRHV